MMQYEDFKDKHAGEDMIIVGNGPSLLNIPVEFLISLPSIGLNYGPWYTDILADGSPSPFKGWVPTYWHGLDPHCFQVIDIMPPTVYAFLSEKDEKDPEYLKRVDTPNFIHYRCYDQVRTVGNTDGLGPTYSTSILSATHIAHHMGVRRFLFVGFDCTFAHQGTERVGDWADNPGVNRIPHWYNGEAVKFKPTDIYQHPAYAEQAEICLEFMQQFDKEIINLSMPTLCTTLPAGNFAQFYPEAIHTDACQAALASVKTLSKEI
jgi:hypothetical protein